jgi:transcriptional regulator with XRE-family HTH domain
MTELLVQARSDAGLSQVDLAARLNRPQSYVSKYESGERRLDLVEFIEVTEAIGCPALSILTLVVATAQR